MNMCENMKVLTPLKAIRRVHDNYVIHYLPLLFFVLFWLY
jgi:hypothetical protein